MQFRLTGTPQRRRGRWIAPLLLVLAASPAAIHSAALAHPDHHQPTQQGHRHGQQGEHDHHHHHD
jgi:hypothetical protein